MRIISLFSGAGGLDLGLIQVGHEIIWANDNDRDAVATYRLNIGDHVVLGDVEKIRSSDIPEGDVIVGGFPHPYAYDAGWSCGGVREPGNVQACDRPRLEEDRWPPSFCGCVRRAADVTDRARKIGESEASVSATGCGRGPPGTTKFRLE